MRRLIAPLNWHRKGYCVFPVLCMYDDLLILEIDGIIKRRARWRDAKADRQMIDKAIRQYVRDTRPQGLIEGSGRQGDPKDFRPS